MKRVLCSFALLAIALFVNAQYPENERKLDDFGSMSFDVELGKDSYFRFEPISVRFSFSNLTGTVKKAYPPQFLQDTSLRILGGGKVSEYRLSSFGRSFQLPADFEPGATYRKNENLTYLLGEFFPRPGKYELQFVLRPADDSGFTSLFSKPIIITIKEPRGLEAEAIEFLERYEKYSVLFAWSHMETNGLELLEEFVARYSGTVYGDFAIFHLGSVYLNNREFDKALAEFSKIAKSSNSLLAEDAQRNIRGIETKHRNK